MSHLHKFWMKFRGRSTYSQRKNTRGHNRYKKNEVFLHNWDTWATKCN